MNKTIVKDTIRLIRKTAGRFFSLTAIIAIGVAFFVGVSGSSYMMSENVDKYIRENNMKDITIYSNYGFDDEDLQAVNDLDDVDQAELTVFVDVLATHGEKSAITRIHAYSEDAMLNRFVLIDGRMPEKENEVLAEAGTDMMPGFEIGAKVTLYRPDNDLNDWLKYEELEVVGTVDSPLYINSTKETSTLSNQYIKTFLFIQEKAFCNEVPIEMNLITKEGKDMNVFSDAYREYTEDVTMKVEELANTQASHRKDVVVSDAMEEYNDGLKEYEDGVKEFNEKIADAEKEIADGEQDLIDGRKDLEDAKDTLRDSEEKLEKEYASNKKKIEDGLKQIEDGKKEVSKNQSTLNQEYKTNKNKIDAGLEKIKDAKKEVSAQQDSLDEKRQQVDEALANMDALDAGIASLEQALTVVDSLEEMKQALTPYESLPVETVIAYDPSGSSKMMFDTLRAMGLVFGDTDTVSVVLYQIDQYESGIYAQSECEDRDAISAKIEELKNTKKEIEEADVLLKEGQKQLDEASALLKKNEKEALAGLGQLEKTIAEAQKKINAASALLNSKEKEAIKGRDTLEKTVKDAKKKIKDGWKDVEDGEQKLIDGEAELIDAKAELADKKAEGEQELADAKQELDDALEEINSLEDNEWTVLDHSKHYSSETYRNTVNQMAAIGGIFPIFFFLVAALVCMTTMTRMIDEERGQIGVMRALGYTTLQCASKYLIYAAGATILGSAIGSALGVVTFPVIIYNAWKMLYIEPDMVIYVPWDLIAIAAVSFLGVMLLTTWLVINADMKEVPAQLMRPKAPKIGKRSIVERITPIWNRLSFTWKVTIRNLLRYKKRLLMTIIGVAGCSALMILGFGIKDSINMMVQLQFDEITHYDGTASFTDDFMKGDTSDFVQEIEARDDVKDLVVAVDYTGKISYQGVENTAVTQVFNDQSQIEKVYTLRTRKKHTPIEINDDGVVISEKLSEDTGVKVGDVVVVESKSGKKAEVKVTAICEMYIQHYIFMNSDVYEKTFNEELKANALYLFGADEDTTVLQSDLASDERVSGINFMDQTIDNFYNMIHSLDFIILVLIGSSMALAFVVLGNLMNINISERQREIATLKVLGFRAKEVQNYIYKENNVLTCLGAIAGIPIGIILHHWIMREVEFSYVMYGRDVMPMSLVISVVITIMFGFLINFFMRKKLADVEMVESLKSVE